MRNDTTIAHTCRNLLLHCTSLAGITANFSPEHPKNRTEGRPFDPTWSMQWLNCVPTPPPST
jgi:hypothetical protein